MGKLVRDHLKGRIKKTHLEATFKKLEKDELEEALRNKLKEEMDEFLEASTRESKIEEAGDLMEVLECLLEIYAIDIKEMQLEKAEKTERNGGFKEGLFWIE